MLFKVNLKYFFYILLFLTILFSLLLTFRNDDNNVSEVPYNKVYYDLNRKGSISEKVGSHAEIPECILEDINPWDESILPFLKPDRSQPVCNVTQDKYTELENGTLYMRKSNAQCKYRCGYPLMHGKVKTGVACIHHRFTYIPDLCILETWEDLIYNKPIKIDCDFVETRCFKNNEVVFAYVHTQARPNSNKKYAAEGSENPSVFILVYDATSSSSGARTLIESQQVLRYNYEAIDFRFYNKVALNSRPNAIAMYTGIRINPLYKGIYYQNDSPPEIQDSCGKFLDRNQTIISHFTDQNYATIMAEDHIFALHYPDCTPFKEVPVEHYGEPLFLLSTEDRATTHGDFLNLQKDKILQEAKMFKKYFYEAECEERHDKLLRYVQNFLDQNEKSSKFIHVWNTILAHENISGLYRWDNKISKFFLHNMKNLENSFIFLMADHGLRLTPVRQTPIGKYEDNNPMLMIAVPKFLRKNKQLMRNLFENSRRHVSTYDFHATLYDILHTAKERKYQDWDFIDYRSHLGEIRGRRAVSLLRPISRDRHCAEMDIPDNFCLCKQIWLPRSNTSTILIEAGQHVIDHINQFLENHDSSANLCMKLNFDGLHTVEEYSPKLRLPVFRIVVRATPSNGLYETIVRLKSDGKWEVINMIDRINAYNKEGDCTKHEETKPLCYCKEQEFGAKDILG